MSDTPAPRAPLSRRIEIAVLTVFGVAATLLMFGNAVMRYLLGSSLVWAEEVIRLMFVWSMFIAVTTAFFRNEHIGFDNLAKKTGPLNFAYRVVYASSLAAVGGILACYGFRYNAMTGSVPLPATNLPTALFMWPGILAGAAWAGLGLYRLLRALVGKSAGGKA
jgi:TRAP-type C4-dicarboxylate transport system permease small subunit